MSNNYYELYEQKCIELAATIVIKSDESVTGLNKFVTDWHGQGAVSELEPETWLYYMTLAGEYHFTHKEMRVVSMDTLEEITFSKENLEIHRATRREYAYGTRYYNELLAQYPDQEQLILGILHPVDKATAIAAADGQILGWNDTLVESNEYSLIKRLQQFIDGYKIRWANKAFTMTDELYSAYNHGIMYANLIPAIINARLAACKTNEAHSYHIKQYLASHGYLDSYIDFLDKKQQLWLYRNVEYIKHNPGHQETFEWLIENVLTAKTIPLAEFTMRHNLSDQPEQDYPTLAFRRAPLNLGYNVDPVDTISLTDILEKEAPTARDNVRYMSTTRVAAKMMMENSLSNVLLTKAVESSMIDRTGATPWALEDILLSEWLHLSSQGIYTAVIGITNPRTSERMPMTVADAYAVMIYCLFGSIGLPLQYVEPVIALRAQRIPGQTVAGMASIVNGKYVTTDMLQQVLEYQPTIVKSDSIISTEAFYNLAQDIYTSAQVQRNLIALQEHQYTRGQLHGAVSSIYADVACAFEGDGQLYATWLTDRNIKITDFTENELGLLMIDVLKEATGLALNTTKSIKDVQAALMRLMAELSSYSIQFLSTINNSSIKVFDWPMIRLGDHLSHVDGEAAFPMPIGHMHTESKSRDSVPYDLGIEGPQLAFHELTRHNASLSIKVEPSIPGPGEGAPIVWHYRLNSAPIYCSRPEPFTETLEGVTKQPNMLDFSYLTAAEYATMRDVYNTTGE